MLVAGRIRIWCYLQRWRTHWTHDRCTLYCILVNRKCTKSNLCDLELFAFCASFQDKDGVDILWIALLFNFWTVFWISTNVFGFSNTLTDLPLVCSIQKIFKWYLFIFQVYSRYCWSNPLHADVFPDGMSRHFLIVLVIIPFCLVRSCRHLFDCEIEFRHFIWFLKCSDSWYFYYMNFETNSAIIV